MAKSQKNIEYIVAGSWKVYWFESGYRMYRSRQKPLILNIHQGRPHNHMACTLQSRHNIVSGGVVSEVGRTQDFCICIHYMNQSFVEGRSIRWYLCRRRLSKFFFCTFPMNYYELINYEWSSWMQNKFALSTDWYWYLTYLTSVVNIDWFSSWLQLWKEIYSSPPPGMVDRTHKPRKIMKSPDLITAWERSHATYQFLCGLQVLKHGVPPHVSNCSLPVPIIVGSSCSVALVMVTAKHRASAVGWRRHTSDAHATVGDHQPTLPQKRQLRLPPQHGPSPAVAVWSRWDDQDRRTLGTRQRAEVPGETILGLPDRCYELGDRKWRHPPVLVGEFEDLQPVLGYGDAHALEEGMVEVCYVLLLELVVRQQEPILVNKVRLKAGVGQPGVPVHDSMLRLRLVCLPLAL